MSTGVLCVDIEKSSYTQSYTHYPQVLKGLNKSNVIQMFVKMGTKNIALEYQWIDDNNDKLNTKLHKIKIKKLLTNNSLKCIITHMKRGI